MTRISPAELAAGFPARFARSAYRLELLDHYVADNEILPYRQFLAGQMPDPAWREPWKRLVREALAAGKTMARVHVVTEPLSVYLRFMLACVYPANVEAGEDVRILPRSAAARLDLPARDYWLFDDREAAVMAYDDEGNWLHADLVDDRDTIADLCRARDRALQQAIPLAAYTTQREAV